MAQANLMAVLPIAAGIAIPILGITIYLLGRRLGKKKKQQPAEEMQNFSNVMGSWRQSGDPGEQYSSVDHLYDKAQPIPSQSDANVIGRSTADIAADLRQEMEERLAVMEQSQLVLLQPLQQELEWLRGRLRGLEKDIEVLMASRHDAAVYGRAVELARQGFSAQKLAIQCGISQGEAEMIIAMQQNKGNLEG